MLAGDDAKIRVWQVPEGGLKETLTEPKIIMQGRASKFYLLQVRRYADVCIVCSRAIHFAFPPICSLQKKRDDLRVRVVHLSTEKAEL